MLFLIFGLSDKLCLMLGLYDEKRYEKVRDSQDLFANRHLMDSGVITTLQNEEDED